MVTTKTKKPGNQWWVLYYESYPSCIAAWSFFYCHHCCESYANSWCLCV